MIMRRFPRMPQPQSFSKYKSDGIIFFRWYFYHPRFAPAVNMVADAAANLTADAVLPTPPIYFGVGGCPSRFWEQENGPYRFRVVRGSSTGEVGADLVRTAAAHSLQTNGFFILEGDVEKPLLAPHDKDSASASLLPPATVAELQARFGLALDHMLDTANYVLENQPGLLDRNTTAGSHPFRAHADLHNREGRYDVETHRLPDPWYGFLSLPINRAFRDAVLPIVQPIFEKYAALPGRGAPPQAEFPKENHFGTGAGR